MRQIPVRLARCPTGLPSALMPPQRSRLRGFTTHQTPIKTISQVQELVAAIMNPRIKRAELRAIAKAMSGGRT